MRKLVRKSYIPIVPIANTCSIGYPHDSQADKAAYRQDRRADNAAYGTTVVRIASANLFSAFQISTTSRVEKVY